MRIKCYCNLYTGSSVTKEKNQYLLDIMNGILKHSVYIITLAQEKQNHLEFFASSLLRQKIYEEKEIFIVGIARTYDETVDVVTEIVQDVLKSTGQSNVRSYIETEQRLFEEGRT